MTKTITQRADFSGIRYAQVWEDADVLVEGLDVQPGDRCVSIASAGDNVFALLTRDPSHVLAVDLSAAQLACLGLRIAAYRTLSHQELLTFIGSRPGTPDARWDCYLRCRNNGNLSPEHAAFWDARSTEVHAGIGAAGRFERYFKAFRTFILPLVHRRGVVNALLTDKPVAKREQFYQETWNTFAWRFMFRIFFSKFVMGRLGRDPEFFRFVDGKVAPHILARAQHALTQLNPAENPYLHWILRGTHNSALPLALRLEHFDTIRSRLDRIELYQGSITQALSAVDPHSIHKFNLSDLFEYLSTEESAHILSACCDVAHSGARLLYWNMLVPRARPAELADRLRPLTTIASDLHLRDKAFFYQRLVIEEIVG